MIMVIIDMTKIDMIQFGLIGCLLLLIINEMLRSR